MGLRVRRAPPTQPPRAHHSSPRAQERLREKLGRDPKDEEYKAARERKRQRKHAQEGDAPVHALVPSPRKRKRQRRQAAQAAPIAADGAPGGGQDPSSGDAALKLVTHALCATASLMGNAIHALSGQYTRPDDRSDAKAAPSDDAAPIDAPAAVEI